MGGNFLVLDFVRLAIMSGTKPGPGSGIGFLILHGAVGRIFTQTSSMCIALWL